MSLENFKEILFRLQNVVRAQNFPKKRTVSVEPNWDTQTIFITTKIYSNKMSIPMNVRNFVEEREFFSFDEGFDAYLKIDASNFSVFLVAQIPMNCKSISFRHVFAQFSALANQLSKNMSNMTEEKFAL